VFENRVLRRILGTKRDEVIGDWRKLYSEGPHIFYSERDKMIQWGSMRWM
jgi:hypothetical protein